MPVSLAPQHHSVPSAFTPQLEKANAATDVHASVPTRLGCDFEPKVPIASVPCRFCPQHQTSPAWFSAHAVPPAASPPENTETRAQSLAAPMRAGAFVTDVAVPRMVPQHHKLPACLIAHV